MSARISPSDQSKDARERGRGGGGSTQPAMAVTLDLDDVTPRGTKADGDVIPCSEEWNPENS